MTQKAFSDLSAEQQSGVRLWVRKQIIALLLIGAILFASAGTLSWVRGWAAWGFFAISAIAQAIVLWLRHPSLLAERAKAQKGTKGWDMAIAALAASLLPMVAMCLAGLDVRHSWSSPVPAWLTIVCVATAIAGWALTIWAMATNAFFAATVRIQDDRGQYVVSNGPYALMRHPGYTGAILFSIATPVILGSWWAMIPYGLAALLFVVRTELEDRTLCNELAGYREYAQHVQWRLLPGVW